MFQADENPPFNTRPASDADAGPALRHSELKRQSASNLSYSLRHHFSDRFHALGRGVGVNNGSAVARNFSGGKGAAFENAVQNFFDPKSKEIGRASCRERLKITGGCWM